MYAIAPSTRASWMRGKKERVNWLVHTCIWAMYTHAVGFKVYLWGFLLVASGGQEALELSEALCFRGSAAGLRCECLKVLRGWRSTLPFHDSSVVHAQWLRGWGGRKGKKVITVLSSACASTSEWLTARTCERILKAYQQLWGWRDDRDWNKLGSFWFLAPSWVFLRSKWCESCRTTQF